MHAALSEAIKTRRVVEFVYDGHPRVVEPHMLAANELGHYALSGWFVAGYSRETRPGWREYLLSDISELEITDSTFPGPRPGYNPTGGTKFPTVYCRL
jgi:predicted DNA-binding transcriptional regulator YafY